MQKWHKTIYDNLPNILKPLWHKIERSDIGFRIAKGTFWSLSGSIISQGLLLLSSIIVARILGKDTYGQFGIIRTTINMFAVFAGFGLGLTATKYISEYKLKDKEKAGRIIGLSTLFSILSGLIISILIIIFAKYIAKNTLNSSHLENQIKIGAIILFFNAINGSQIGILAGFESFKSIAKINFIAGVMAFPIQILLTFYGGLSGAIIGFGFNFFILWILSIFSVKRISKLNGIHIDLKNFWQEYKILYKFSLPTLLAGLLVSPIMWVCNVFLVNQPNGYGQMAIFDVANQWRNIILFIPLAISQVALPLFSEVSKNQGKFYSYFYLNLKVTLIISSIFGIIIIIFSKIILSFYGNDFISGYSVLIVMALTTIISSANNVVGQAIAGKGKMWIGLLFNMIWGISIIISSWILINRGLGAFGLSLAYLISYIIHTFIQFRFILGKKNLLYKNEVY